MNRLLAVLNYLVEQEWIAEMSGNEELAEYYYQGRLFAMQHAERVQLASYLVLRVRHLLN